MAKRRILALILIVAAIVVIAVVFATVFTVSSVDFVFYDEEGDMIAIPENSPTGNDILEKIGRQSIFFLSKASVLNSINSAYTDFHAIEVVKSFPNVVTIHLVKRVAVFSLNVGSQVVFIDSFGYVTDASSENVIDVTSTFTISIPSQMEKGSKLQFNTENDNQRLDMMLDAVGAVWRLHYAFSDISKIISKFEFDADTLTLTTPNGTQIVVYSPESNLDTRLINGFSVYYNDIVDLQRPGVTITISASGNIQTTN